MISTITMESMLRSISEKLSRTASEKETPVALELESSWEASASRAAASGVWALT